MGTETSPSTDHSCTSLPTAATRHRALSSILPHCTNRQWFAFARAPPPPGSAALTLIEKISPDKILRSAIFKVWDHPSANWKPLQQIDMTNPCESWKDCAGLSDLEVSTLRSASNVRLNEVKIRMEVVWTDFVFLHFDSGKEPARLGPAQWLKSRAE